MEKTKINFRLPTATLKVIDGMAAADHRDRTSMVNKIIDFYLTHHRAKPTTKPAKKVGAR